MATFDSQLLNTVLCHVQKITGPFSEVPVCSQAPGLRIENNHLYCEDANTLARGLFLWQAGKQHPELLPQGTETRHFASCGMMLDQSRNAVLRPDAVRRYIDISACLGMNMMMLYCEDTYTLTDYPAFGHLRGRYTREELTALDAYAAEVGVELVPCIQTLAHLATFLTWPSSAGLRDQRDILLIDEPETEALIRAMIQEMRACFRSGRIHIGMDEAHGVGLGVWREKHGTEDRFALLNRHLTMVCSICAEYDFHPMMWSDMFFRLGSKHNEYYDREAVIPDSVIESLPDVDLVYWDYYHTEEDLYEHMLVQHERMGKPVFAGGIWTWSGFLPNIEKTRRTSMPALRVCARHQVDTVFATLWEDDGAETSHALAVSQFPYFSEFCWCGPDVREEHIRAVGALVSGLDPRMEDAYALFYPVDMDVASGKQLIWVDPFLPLTGLSSAQIALSEQRALEALEQMKGLPACPETEYTQMVFDVIVRKCHLLNRLRADYTARDMPALSADAAALRQLAEAYRALHDAHRALWLRDCRRFGWEVLSQRYGGSVQRLLDAADDLEQFVQGRLETMEELEAPVLHEPHGYGHRALITAGEQW